MDILPGYKLCRKKLHQYPKNLKTCPDCKKIATLKVHTCALPPGFKICCCCKKLLETKHFYKHSRNKLRNDCKKCAAKKNKKYYKSNIDKIKQNQKIWDANNRNKIKEAKIKRKFGINLLQKEKLFAQQNFSCAICKKTKNVRDRDWDIDHCHATEKIRGILCSNCNRGLGLFGDDPTALLNAFYYLIKHR